MIDRLPEDHRNAKQLVEGLVQIKGIETDVSRVENNILLFSTAQLGLNAHELVEKLKEQGILANTFGQHRIRFVTHREVSTQDIERTIEAAKAICAK